MMHKTPMISRSFLPCILIFTLLLSCSNDNSVSENKFPAAEVYAISIDESGVVWAGTDIGIISYSKGKWNTYKDIRKLPLGKASDIVLHTGNNGNELWLATPNGAGVASIETDAITSATQYVKDSSGLLDNRISAVLIDALEARWFATTLGLSIFKGDKWYTETDWDDLKSNPVISLGAKNDGWVFAGTNGLGVGRFRYDEDIDGITGASYYNKDWTSLPSDTVLCIYVDQQNFQWFGTPHGVAYHAAWETKKEWKVYTVADGLIDNRVQAITEDGNGNVWFGTPKGLSVFNGEEWKSYTSADGLIQSNVNDIAADADGTLWFATGGGISTFDGTVWKSFR
jgi:ligand-binding sensor domain-containing protein